MEDIVEIDEKYTVEINWKQSPEKSIFRALRYGQDWRNLNGDGLILAMVYKIQELENENLKLRENT